MNTRVRPGKCGRVVMPAGVRKALGLASGDELVLQLEDGEVLLIPLDRAVAMAQARVRKYDPKEHLWSMSSLPHGARRPSVGSTALDASALLALLNHQSGSEVVSELLEAAAVSTVNLAEADV